MAELCIVFDFLWPGTHRIRIKANEVPQTDTTWYDTFAKKNAHATWTQSMRSLYSLTPTLTPRLGSPQDGRTRTVDVHGLLKWHMVTGSSTILYSSAIKVDDCLFSSNQCASQENCKILWNTNNISSISILTITAIQRMNVVINSLTHWQTGLYKPELSLAVVTFLL